jgi:hypothetical protein
MELNTFLTEDDASGLLEGICILQLVGDVLIHQTVLYVADCSQPGHRCLSGVVSCL